MGPASARWSSLSLITRHSDGLVMHRLFRKEGEYKRERKRERGRGKADNDDCRIARITTVICRFYDMASTEKSRFLRSSEQLIVLLNLQINLVKSYIAPGCSDSEKYKTLAFKEKQRLCIDPPHGAGARPHLPRLDCGSLQWWERALTSLLPCSGGSGRRPLPLPALVDPRVDYLLPPSQSSCLL